VDRARSFGFGQASASVRRLVASAGGPRLICAGMLDAAGTGLLIPLTVLFFVIHVGLPAHLVGLGMSIGGVLAMVLAPFGGHLVDRFGAKRALICAWLLGCVAVSCYGLVRSWLEIILVITAVGFAGNVSGTSRSTLVASIVDRADISRVMAIQRSFRNAGYGLGGLMATAALAVGGGGFVAAIAVDAASFLLAALLVSGLIVPRAQTPSADRDADPVTMRTVLSDRRYMAMTALDALTAFHQVALQVALPLWVVLFTHAPRALVGLLFTVNTVIVVIGQVRVSRDVRGLADAPGAYVRGAASMIAAGALFLAAHYVGAAPAVVLLVVGAVMMTASEMYASAADWVLSFGLADDNHRGKYLAVYSMGDAFGDAVGPSVTTALTSVGAIPVWPVIAAVVAVGSLASGAIARSAARQERATDAKVEPALG
jgi:MFS family permease